MKKSLLLLCPLALAFTNCTTVNPYTGESQTSNAAIGGAIGTAAGALVGGIIGNNTGDGDQIKGALIGAGIGGAAGGGIGFYMDQQEAKIRQQLQSSGVSVSRLGNDIILNMPSDITFDVAQSQLKGQFLPTLDSVAVVLGEYNKTTIAISGHTDSDGGDSYNQGLSESRANSVASYFSSKGISGNRLAPSGYGERAPVASNATAAGKAQNRRVELRIVPVQSQF